ncbi:hypothetical protein GCM10010358_06060 [Streptomyces minutiscleroticus]|uniref:Uncharacterized protein n=1 Tax=Streptomyces minutiscleroticus TaxID=68238 RepID=A0A918K8Q2_9ACTN|nr:hypothetical protein GCM10010358_06060 [Streptomyces minutiscleroticus]
MVDGRQDGRGEHQRHQGDQRPGQVAAPGEDEQDDRDHRDTGRPLQRGGPEVDGHAAIVAEVNGPRTPAGRRPGLARHATLRNAGSGTRRRAAYRFPARRTPASGVRRG